MQFVNILASNFDTMVAMILAAVALIFFGNKTATPGTKIIFAVGSGFLLLITIVQLVQSKPVSITTATTLIYGAVYVIAVFCYFIATGVAAYNENVRQAFGIATVSCLTLAITIRCLTSHQTAETFFWLAGAVLLIWTAWLKTDKREP